MQMLKALALITVCSLATGCGRFAVRASEKEFLADRVMVFDNDPQQVSADEHVISEREGAAGGHGAGGGGCGCN
jgi:predicted RNA methylase